MSRFAALPRIRRYASQFLHSKSYTPRRHELRNYNSLYSSSYFGSKYSAVNITVVETLECQFRPKNPNRNQEKKSILRQMPRLLDSSYTAVVHLVFRFCLFFVDLSFLSCQNGMQVIIILSFQTFPVDYSHILTRCMSTNW